MPWLLVLALFAALLPASPTPTTFAAESVPLPVSGGKPVKIIQGYNGGTHQGRSRFGLDLVLAEGSTGGAEVVSPVDGTIGFVIASGNGCVSIAFRDDDYSVMMCHLKLDKSLTRGATVTRGQKLGTIGEAGTYGNNGVAHIHLELHKGGRASSPVPFDAPEGLLLEGVALAANGAHASRAPLVSSNRTSTESAGTTVAQASGSTQKMSATSEPVTVTAASVPSTVRSIQPSGASATTTATRLAVVKGTDSCLNVRKQPAASAPIVGCLKEGSEVALKPLASGADAKWRQVDQGWVSSEFLKRTQSVVAGTGDCLNVRESAKASAKSFGCLPDGTSVTIADGPTTAGGFSWYKIEAAGSVERAGWVVGKYLD